MLGLKLNHVSKRGPWRLDTVYLIYIYNWIKDACDIGVGVNVCKTLLLHNSPCSVKSKVKENNMNTFGQGHWFILYESQVYAEHIYKILFS